MRRSNKINDDFISRVWVTSPEDKRGMHLKTFKWESNRDDASFVSQGEKMLSLPFVGNGNQFVNILDKSGYIYNDFFIVRNWNVKEVPEVFTPWGLKEDDVERENKCQT